MSSLRPMASQLLAESSPRGTKGRTATDGAEAVTLVTERRPDIVLMDLSMPNVDGIEATRQILEIHPDVAIVVLTSFGDQRKVLDALDAGAVGYLLKQADPEHILDALRATAAGGAPLDPKAARVLLESRERTASLESALTDREREVLKLVADGLANKVIALRLGISERTVKAHLTNIFQRIGVTDRTQAALWARENLSGRASSEER